MIKHQVIKKTSSYRQRRQLLEMRNLTLDIPGQTAQPIKFSEKQALMMERWKVRYIYILPTEFKRTKHKSAKKAYDQMCNACGRRCHMKHDPNCPTKKLSCHNCRKQGLLRRCVKVKSQHRMKLLLSGNISECPLNAHGLFTEIRISGIQSL